MLFFFNLKKNPENVLFFEMFWNTYQITVSQHNSVRTNEENHDALQFDDITNLMKL